MAPTEIVGSLWEFGQETMLCEQVCVHGRFVFMDCGSRNGVLLRVSCCAKALYKNTRQPRLQCSSTSAPHVC